MSPERWKQVKELFETILSLDPSERESYLTSHCADPELRSEVESLLVAHEETGHFLEEPVASLSSFGVDTRQETAAIGMRVGPWELVEEIGRGGMGTVYLAVRADQQFRKRVAIKLIRRGMENEFAVRRFRNERQILAKLEHPNIARLIDGGTTRDDLPYFVMEYVEGEPLNKYCENHSLSPGERVEIFLRVCSAVHYAHRRMIIHRDLKPGNILVKKDGTPKLLDFGIAKVLDPEDSADIETTLVGAKIVTPAYASPEQMRGEPATLRSDIYSLAIVLFELLTGRRPAQDPVAFEQLEPGLRKVLSKAMRQESDDRFDSVEAFMTALQRSLTSTGQAHVDTNSSGQPMSGSVAILPFRILQADSAGDAYLGLGITDAVITKLSNVGRISVRSTSAVMRYAEAPDASAAGRELNVEFVVEGRLHKTGNRVRATVQLVRVRTGTPAWAGTFDEELEDLLKVEDSISGQVAQALVPQLTGEEREQLARRGTLNPKAHQAYLRGRWYWSQHTEDSLAKALVSFMQAIAEDPQYAQAHAGVADYYIQLGAYGGLPPHESFAAAKQSAQTAVEIDSSLAEAHASLGFSLWAFDRDVAAALHEFQLAIALNPDYATAHHWFGLLNSVRGKAEVAIASLERARRLDPLNPTLAAALGLAFYHAREYDRGVHHLRTSIQGLGDVAALYEMLAWNLLELGDKEKAREAAQRAVELSDRGVFALAALAQCEAAGGRIDAAKAVLAEVEGRAETRYISGYALGLMQLACGNRKRALEELERAWLARDWWTVWLPSTPRWDPLRSEPVFFRLAGAQSVTELLPVPLPRKTKPEALKPSRRGFLIGAGSAAALAAGGLYWTLRPVTPPFQKTRIAKITTNGTALRAAISPDGSYVAYSASQGGKGYLFLRPLTSNSANRIAGPFEGLVDNVEFTRKGTHVSFAALAPGSYNQPSLYIVSISGGTPELLINRLEGPASLSPDGSMVAFVRPNPGLGADELIVADSNGTGERRVAQRKYPERFTFNATPAWSVDSKTIACGLEGSDKQGFLMSLMVVDPAAGTSRIVTSPRWQYIGRVAWSGDSRALYVIGQEQDASFQQIWFTPLRRGSSARLTNDLNDYIGVSLPANDSAMVSVQRQTLSNVYIVKAGTPTLQITPGSGRYFDLCWTPDGRLAYASDASGSADIWIMSADGSGQQRQLTPGTSRAYSPAVSPDGRFIAYHSNRSGNWNIWRMDVDGRNAVQLTQGNRDSNWPVFTPDSQWIVYHHTGPNGMFNVWRVPTAGGTPVQLSEAYTTHPDVSLVDGRIACWYSEEVSKPNWRIAVLPAAGGTPERLLDFPSGMHPDPDMPIRWTPDGKAISYIGIRNGVHNIGVLPLDGGSLQTITDFTWGEIFSFDWAPDGRLAVSRGMSTSDVVLIRQA